MSKPLMLPPFQLFRRERSDVWHVRFSLNGVGQIRLSTGCSTRDQAEAAAQQIVLTTVFRKENSLPLKSRTLGDVCDEYLSWLAKEVQQQQVPHSRLSVGRSDIGRFIKPFLDDRTIESVRSQDITALCKWARTYWLDGPGASISVIKYHRGGRIVRRKPKGQVLSRASLDRITIQLRRVFAFAVDRGYLRKDQLPEFPKRKADDNPRPTFSHAELTLLIQALCDQCSPATIANAAIRRDRVLLLCLVGMLAHSGMRPTDLYKLRWRSIEGFPWSQPPEPMVEAAQLIADPTRISMLRAEEVRIYAEGKKSPRKVIPNSEFARYLTILLTQTITDRKRCPSPNEPVFAHPDGVRIRSLRNGLVHVLTRTGLLKDAFGKRRTAYSLRHFYISKAIEAGVNIYVIARNCGTSVDMIQRFYAKDDIEVSARQLTDLGEGFPRLGDAAI
jgi:integrase